MRLFLFELGENIDSTAWAIASKPDEDLINFGDFITKSGNKKNSSGNISFPATEYLILLI